jgi:tyrosyl-tRNA synthetase
VAQSNLVDSRGQAKRALAQGGLYVNNQRWEANSGLVSAEHLLFGRYLLLRLGKRNYDLMVFSS